MDACVQQPSRALRHLATGVGPNTDRHNTNREEQLYKLVKMKRTTIFSAFSLLMYEFDGQAYSSKDQKPSLYYIMCLLKPFFDS